VAFQADAARNLIRADPVRADALLGELRGRTAEAFEDIRRPIYELRPPSLDELGLVAALHRQGLRAEGCHPGGDHPGDPGGGGR
jgi:two-component system NarL family sensor kinase